MKKKLDQAAVARLYDQGLTDKEIAAQLGTTRNAIQSWRWKRKLPPNGENLLSSLCWDCANAYANKCFAVPFERRSWVKKYEQHVPPAASLPVRKVLECERFESDGREGGAYGKAR